MYEVNIQSVGYIIEIVFPTKGTVTLASTDSLTVPNKLESLRYNAVLSGQNSNPVGVVSANTVSINLTSQDLSLDPTNESSPYYGEMNSEAYIRIKFIDNQEEINLGTFYVTSWEPNITNTTPFNINIESVDLLSILSKMPIPFIVPTTNMTLNAYLLLVFNELNNINPEKYHVNTSKIMDTDSPIASFYYEQLDTSIIGDMLNTICQCMLWNITIDENNTLIISEITREYSELNQVMNIDGAVSTYAASLAPSNIINFSQVKLTYIPRKLIANQQLSSQSTISLVSGDNNIELNLAGHVNLIQSINIDNPDTADLNTLAYVKSFSYNKDMFKGIITLENNSGTDMNISIIGTVASTDTEVYNKNVTGAVLDMKNPIIIESNIQQYINNMNKVIENKSKDITVTGWYNPRIRLNDLVYVSLTGDLNTVGYYYINSINMDLAQSLTYQLGLTKVVVA